MEAHEENNREKIFRQLKERNRRHSQPYENLFSTFARLQSQVECYQNGYWQLKGEKECLQQELADVKNENYQRATKGGGGNGTTQDMRNLGKELKEVKELFTRNRDLNTEMLDLKLKLRDKEQRLEEIEDRLVVKDKQILTLDDLCKSKVEIIINLEKRILDLQEETQKVKIEHCSVRRKLSHIVLEKNELLKQLHELQGKFDIDFPEDEDDNLSSDSDDCALVSPLPSHVAHEVMDQEGDMNGVKWCPSGRMFASSSKVVSLWEVNHDKCYCIKKLNDENGVFTSIEFGKEGECLVAACNVGPICMWSLPSYKKQPNFMGHSEKVTAAKFLGSTKLVSGSFDRTVRVWDVETQACTSTRQCISACNDLITLDGTGTNIITGHWDRNIRFWDTRAATQTKELGFSGAITSLDLSPDSSSLLACLKDSTLKVIDLRNFGNFKVLKTLSTKGFQVAADWARAVFSPDGRHAVAGSLYGSLYVWSISRGEVVKILSKTHSSGVVACSWHLSNKYVVSCDKQKKAVVWKCK